MNGLIFSHLFRKNLPQLRNEEAFKFLEKKKQNTTYFFKMVRQSAFDCIIHNIQEMNPSTTEIYKAEEQSSSFILRFI